MNFLIVCRDKPDQQANRAATRAAHLDHIQSRGAALKTGGPLLSDDGSTPIGSAYIMAFDDKAAAEAFADADPYNQAGIFETITVTAWRQVLPKE